MPYSTRNSCGATHLFYNWQANFQSCQLYIMVCMEKLLTQLAVYETVQPYLLYIHTVSNVPCLPNIHTENMYSTRYSSVGQNNELCCEKLVIFHRTNNECSGGKGFESFCAQHYSSADYFCPGAQYLYPLYILSVEATAFIVSKRGISFLTGKASRHVNRR